jgi:hypothetical protein
MPGDEMYRSVVLALAMNAVMLVPVAAQPNQLRASVIGGGNIGEGKCLIEAVVSGAADLEIRGDNAVLRGAYEDRAEWRRFECTARMPDYPTDLRLRSVAGRGSVQLLPSRNDGSILVHIDGPSDGAERHALELTWAVNRSYGNGGPGNSNSGIGSNSNQRRDVANQAERLATAFSPEEAIRLCQDGVREQVRPRLGMGDLEFRSARIENTQPQDSVTGEFVFLDPNRSEVVYRFYCSVDFAGRRIHAVQFDQAGGDAYASPRRIPSPLDAAVLACRDAVQSRLDRSGYDDVSFVAIDPDRRSGRGDWVAGSAQAVRGNRSARLDFSCRMNLSTGNVRTVTVTRR